MNRPPKWKSFREHETRGEKEVIHHQRWKCTPEVRNPNHRIPSIVLKIKNAQHEMKTKEGEMDTERNAYLSRTHTH